MHRIDLTTVVPGGRAAAFDASRDVAAHAASMRRSRQRAVAGVTFCDSLGIAALVRIYRHSNALGCRVRLTNARDRVAHVLHISGLDQVLEVVPDWSPGHA